MRVVYPAASRLPSCGIIMLKVDKTAKNEYAVLGCLLVVFIMALLPALVHARREVRDGERRQELRQLKHALEMSNNKLGYYPKIFDAAPFTYVILAADGEAAIAWYIRALMENRAEPAAGLDLEYNMYYRIVNESGLTYYDICGGEFRCDVPANQ